MDPSDSDLGGSAPVFSSRRDGGASITEAASCQDDRDPCSTGKEDEPPVTDVQDAEMAQPMEDLVKRLDALTKRVEALEAGQPQSLEAQGDHDPTDTSADASVAEIEDPDEPATNPMTPNATFADMSVITEAVRAALAERSDETTELRDMTLSIRDSVASHTEFVESALGDISASLERMSTRPLPAPDLTLQKQGFARIATALSAALARFDALASESGAAIARIEESLSSAGNAAPGAATESPQLPPGESDRLEVSMSAFVDRLEALVASMAPTQGAGAPDMSHVPTLLEDICGRLTDMLEGKTAQGEPSLTDELRDLRTLVAELIADNRRLQVA